MKILHHLVREAMSLAKPSYWLLPAGDSEQHVGTWGGYGPALGPPSEVPHLVTVNLGFLQGEYVFRDCISVFNNSAELAGDCILHQASLPGAGMLLAAHARISLPPLEALFRFGGGAIPEWLAQNGWKAEWGYNSNFPDSELVNAYEEKFQAQHPLYSGEAPVVLGGWHNQWPDDDWQDLMTERLILTTYWDTEPWVEVWQHGSEFRVLNRVT